MPRSTHLDLLVSLKQQSTQLLRSLHTEISNREKELAELKAEIKRWTAAFGPEPRSVAPAKGPAVKTKRRARRLDWAGVLLSLPNTFSAKDVAKATGKPMEQVYAGVSRWTKDKKIKKGKNGYQKA